MKKKMLFVAQVCPKLGMDTFVKRDLDILKQQYDITLIEFSRIRQIFRLVREMPKNDMVFCWFGKLHAFFAVLLAKIFGKRSIVVAGGDEVSNQTQTGRPYGVFSGRLKGMLIRWLFKNADHVIAVSEFARSELQKNAAVEQGKITLIYHSFDGEAFARNNRSKSKIALTVGTICKEDYFRKGYIYFIESAKRMPDFTFYLVGPQTDSFLNQQVRLPGNVIVLNRGLYGQPLIELMNDAAVYLQLSDWETFGCAVAEAMLCECVPVVSRYGALPEVVGECGLYVDSFDPAEIETKIREAERKQAELGPKARAMILDKFSTEGKKKILLELVKRFS